MPGKKKDDETTRIPSPEPVLIPDEAIEELRKNPPSSPPPLAAVPEPPKLVGTSDGDGNVLPLNLEYDEHGFPCLNAIQTLLFRAVSAEDELAKVRLENAMLKRQLWLEQQAAYRLLGEEIGRAQVEREGKAKEYRATIDQISAETGVQLTGCIISDVTGRITFMDTRDRPIVGASKPPDHARLKKQ